MSKSSKTSKPVKTARRNATSVKTGTPASWRRKGPGKTAKAAARNGTKQALLIGLLGCAEGASVAEMAAKAGWQPHSVRGFLSGTVKKKLGLKVTSAQVEGRGRVYRMARKG